MTVLKVATCQFPVSADIEQNAGWITRQMHESAEQGARVAHFPEGALSGYAGTDFETFTGYDWDALTAPPTAYGTCKRAGHLVGSRVSAPVQRRQRTAQQPVRDQRRRRGHRADDKRFGGTHLDYYSPGSRFSTWVIDGIRCGALICYDYRFPELYRRYVTLDVQLMFHSFHAANASPERVAAIGAAIGTEHAPLNPAATLTYPGITDPSRDGRLGRVQQHVDLLPTSSAPESLWPAFFVRSTDHDRPGGTQRTWCPDIHRGYGPGPVRLYRTVAAPGYRRHLAQRGAGGRRPLDDARAAIRAQQRGLVIPGYIGSMKTAISLPEHIFSRPPGMPGNSA